MSLCQVFPENYACQLKDKVKRVADSLQIFGVAEMQVEVHASTPTHYRNRVEFRIWHEGDQHYYAMFDANVGGYVEIKQCPIAEKPIADLMAPLLHALCKKTELIYRLYQVEFLCSRGGEVLVGLIYKKKLDDAWVAFAKQLEADLGIHIVGRSRKQKLVLSQDFLISQQTSQSGNYSVKLMENVFNQPNTGVNDQMVDWAIANTALPGGVSSGDLLDLYCGSGNFTLPLHRNFRQLLGVEVSKRAVAAGQWAVEQNQVENVSIQAMQAETFSASFSQTLNTTSMYCNGRDYDFDCVVVDPPRSGLDVTTCNIVKGFNRVVYFSCSLESLIRDMGVLSTVFSIDKVAVFDQFPYTSHIETAVVLRRE